MDFTMDDVEREIRRLVQENPDFVYGQQEEIQAIQSSGTCSYMAGITKDDFDYAKDQGLIQTATYEDALEAGELGKACLIGQALHNLGVDRSTLESYEELGADYVINSMEIPVGSIQNPEVFVEWVETVQRGQDSNMPWTTSLANADEKYGSRIIRA